MTATDPFTEAARAEAEKATAEYAVQELPTPTEAGAYESGFLRGWRVARTHLTAQEDDGHDGWCGCGCQDAQEPTDAEVEAAAAVWQTHSRLHHPVEGLEPSCAECGYAFGWAGISASEEGRRYREHVARAALSAARAARRDEEKRDG